MAAYVLVDIKVTDPVGYEEYKRLAPVSIKLYGGKYLVRGGLHETLEGEWSLNRLIILVFESKERAKAWLNSPEYAPARTLRHIYADSRMIVVESL
jgi:uncharacterized protein (DUF1330 family)